MRTWSLAVGLILFGTIAVHGDYYRFTYIPYATPEKDKDKEKNGPGGPGMPPGMNPQFPGQFPGMFPGQFPGGQFPGMFPGQFPGMFPGQFPGMMPFRPKPKPGEEVKQTDEDDEVDLTQVRQLVVEVKKRQVVKSLGKLMIESKYGKTTLHKADAVSYKRLVGEKNRPIPTVAEKYEQRKKDLLKEKKTADPEKILENAEFCLSHGLYNSFPKEMDDFAEKSAKHPIAAAWTKTKEALKKAPGKTDRGAYWKDHLTGTYRMTSSSHYVCLYNSRDEAEIIRRLNRLEETYRAFYYWFALKGMALPALEQRQVVVFVDKPEEFAALYQAFGAPLRDGDAFLARRENVAIFSMTPIDEFYDLLSKSSNQIWTVEKWNKSDLLAGRFRPGEKPDDSAYYQEIALLLKGMEDECEVAAITRVGSQQLWQAMGMVPGTVSVPLWLQSGLGSFFETPKGAYWPGTAAPHWRYFVNFVSWRDDPRTREKPEDILINTLTDQYFYKARLAGDPAQWERAQTMAWALTYFLAQDQNNRDAFVNYLKELSNLPRDMPISTDTHLLCFVRAFGLVKETDPNKIDMAMIRKGSQDFARTWYMKYMSTVSLDMPDVWSLWRKTEAQKQAKLAALEAEAKKMPGGVGAQGVNPADPRNPMGPNRPGMPPMGRRPMPMPPGPRRAP